MIASGGPCYSDRLVRLLESQLNAADERAVTSHLDHCEARLCNAVTAAKYAIGSTI